MDLSDHRNLLLESHGSSSLSPALLQQSEAANII
eukprot:XP_001704260.1 Hypothetical protein GL50803_116835 [Giardia lamblia ATCC 50803]